MNKAKGKEMICGIVISYLGTNLYHLIFMVGYGTIIPPRNSDMVLSTGVGLRNNMLDSAMYRDVFHQFLLSLLEILKIAFYLYLLLFYLLYLYFTLAELDLDIS